MKTLTMRYFMSISKGSLEESTEKWKHSSLMALTIPYKNALKRWMRTQTVTSGPLLIHKEFIPKNSSLALPDLNGIRIISKSKTMNNVHKILNKLLINSGIT